MSGILAAVPGSFAPAAGGGVDSPDDISGLTVWLKADALGFSDNDPVTTWADSSGNSNDCTVNTNKPTFKTAIVNSLPVVRFNGTNNELVGTTNIGVSQPNTIFFVVNKTSSATGRLMDSSPRQLVDIAATTSLVTMYAGNNGLTGSHSIGGGFHVLSMVFNGASSAAWVDGASDISTGTDAGSAGISTYYLCADNAASAFCACDIAEFIIYNSSLSTGNRRAIEAYLGTKYNITVV